MNYKGATSNARDILKRINLMRLSNMCQEIRMCPARSNSTMIGLKKRLAFKECIKGLYGPDEMDRIQPIGIRSQKKAAPLLTLLFPASSFLCLLQGSIEFAWAVTQIE
jgi:hypothetical protein